jgi:hypothetical protein
MASSAADLSVGRLPDGRAELIEQVEAVAVRPMAIA